MDPEAEIGSNHKDRLTGMELVKRIDETLAGRFLSVEGLTEAKTCPELEFGALCEAVGKPKEEAMAVLRETEMFKKWQEMIGAKFSKEEVILLEQFDARLKDLSEQEFAVVMRRLRSFRVTRMLRLGTNSLTMAKAEDDHVESVIEIIDKSPSRKELRLAKMLASVHDVAKVYKGRPYVGLHELSSAIVGGQVLGVVAEAVGCDKDEVDAVQKYASIAILDHGLNEFPMLTSMSNSEAIKVAEELLGNIYIYPHGNEPYFMGARDPKSEFADREGEAEKKLILANEVLRAGDMLAGMDLVRSFGKFHLTAIQNPKAFFEKASSSAAYLFTFRSNMIGDYQRAPDVAGLKGIADEMREKGVFMLAFAFDVGKAETDNGVQSLYDKCAGDDVELRKTVEGMGAKLLKMKEIYAQGKEVSDKQKKAELAQEHYDLYISVAKQLVGIDRKVFEGSGMMQVVRKAFEGRLLG